MMRAVVVGAAAIIAVPAWAQEDVRPSHIQVQGMALVETNPDEARMTYTVNGEGKTADDASRALATKQKAIRDGIASLLGRNAELTTGEVTISEVRAPQCDANPYGRPRLSEGPCAVIGYVAAITSMVRTAAVDRIGTAVGLAARLGARDARMQSFDLADPGAAKRRAITAAITDARRRAEALANGAGVRLGELLTLSDQNGGDVVVQGIEASDIGAFSGPPAPPAPPAPVPIDVKPRPIETRATVYARYAIAR